MNIYYSFNDFMNRVIEVADLIAHQRHGLGLEEIFDVSRTTVNVIATLLTKGSWLVFIGVVALFTLSWIAFLAALTPFLLNPIGVAVVAIFGRAAIPTLKRMYKEKILPITIKEIGEQYKKHWENADNNPSIIDRLLNEAAHELYRRAISRGVKAIVGN